MNVFITGYGCISPIGFNAVENRLGLIAEKDGLVKSKYLNSKYAQAKYFGEVKLDNSTLANRLNVGDIKGLTRTDLLALTAFEEAIQHAGLSADEISSVDTAFISASTVGGMCLTDELYRDANMQSEHSDYVDAYSGAAHTLFISRQYKIKGFTNTINTACSSSANAIMMGMRLIQAGRAKRAIVGGVDCLAKYTVNGFNSLGILTEQKCKPFDVNREGLNLGEASAYLILEAEDICASKTKYAKVIGAGNTNDAYHSSSMSDTAIGVTKCIEIALQEGGISPEQISYINAHGTGTPNNDQVELTGFSNIFKTIPPFSSTKSYTGHTLGAAGALEAIFSILSLTHSELYPSLNTQQAIEGFNTQPVQAYTPNVELKYILSNSYGFGGNCTSLLFSKA